MRSTHHLLLILGLLSFPLSLHADDKKKELEAEIERLKKPNAQLKSDLEVAKAKFFERFTDKSKVDAAKLSVQQLPLACRAYEVSLEIRPKTLMNRVEPLKGKPYLEDADALIDPWGRMYRYDSRGMNQKEPGDRPDLWSLGPTKDGKSKIGN